MTYSEITIEFLEDLEIGSEVTFKVGSTISDRDPVEYKETWVNMRAGSNQVTTETPNSTVGDVSAFNYLKAFYLDYNSLNSTYEVSSIGNKVLIKSKSPYLQFSEGLAIRYVDDLQVLLNVQFTINNYSGTVFTLDSYEFLSHDNNSYLKLRCETSDLATKIISPVSIDNTDNPFEIEVLRGSVSTNLKLENSEGQQIDQIIFVPSAFTSDNLTVTVNNSPNGGTVIAQTINTTDLTFTYSIDNTTWQVSNVFDSLPEGSYTMYVKDQFDVAVSKTFVVNNIGVDEPYFYISSSNSIRFALNSEDGIQSDKRIDQNRLSYEDFTDVLYKEIQHFQSDDIITTQYKTNYSNVSVSVVQNEIETSLGIIQQSNNLDLKDSRDAIKFNYGNNKTGIYFIAGNKYDFDTGLVTGDYTLNGNLPEWAKVGEYIKIDNAWLEIENVFPSDDKQAEIIVLNVPYTGDETTVIVGSIYNRENYDLFEFITSMGLFQNFQIKIHCLDDRFQELIYLSEDIEVKEDLSGFSEITYSNDTNTDINYSTGIENKLWIEMDNVSGVFKGDSETHLTDTKTILLNGNVQQGKEFKTIPYTLGIIEKVFKAFHHRELYIDGEKYVLFEEPEVEGRLDDSNLYVLTARLIKANELYKAKSYNSSLPYTGELVEIPAFISIDGGSGFIKI